jgi:8-oxo-dGTP diphosphatase
MTLYIVRHADAKSRSGWSADDHLRPLTKKGERQAAAIPRVVTASNLRRVLSSPAVRCVDTVVPLAHSHGLEVECTPELLEGSEPKAAYGLLLEEASRKGDSVLCMHGDLIPELLRRVARDGAKLTGGDRWSKGSTWVLSVEHGRVTSGKYTPPPS